MRFTFSDTPLPGLLVIQPQVVSDARGVFLESFRRDLFSENGVVPELVQDNCSVSARGVLRGMHFQTPPAELGKLVWVAMGRAYDAAVDLRTGSPTYGKWFGLELTGENHTMIYVPPGFAHGFLALEDNTVFLYKQSGYYSPEHEGGLRYDDPDVGILWPMREELIVSDRDAASPLLKDFQSPFSYA